jgi:hypothetical protein
VEILKCRCGGREFQILRDTKGGKTMWCPDDISGAAAIRIYLITHPKDEATIEFSGVVA